MLKSLSDISIMESERKKNTSPFGYLAIQAVWIQFPKSDIFPRIITSYSCGQKAGLT
jgi:hypothetical protein